MSPPNESVAADTTPTGTTTTVTANYNTTMPCGYEALSDENRVLKRQIQEMEAKLAAHQAEIRQQKEQMREHLDQQDVVIQERTTELERVNADLNKANAEIKLQSKTLLEHFSCMSHEIRYV